MRIEVDKDVCIGAGMCALTAPEVFTQDDDGLSELLPGAAGRPVADGVREAARVCPVRAISTGEDGPGRP
ncbi:ferredoxin [Streptomyces sp. NPDC014894]|uniref:ferredoxin n=1 Tax=unclassified Streptomyces TaxID=2593676 RepID=UPI0036F90A31